MKVEIGLDQVAGRMLDRVLLSGIGGQAILLFADGTFTALGIDRGYDSGDEEIISEPLNRYKVGESALVESGIATQAELDADRAAKRSAQEAQSLLRARAEYERLKRLFND